MSSGFQEKVGFGRDRAKMAGEDANGSGLSENI